MTAYSDLLLGVEGVNADQYFRSLQAWLAHEDDFRGRVSTRRQPIRPGEMGSVIDVLVVALGSGGAGAVLARSVTTWLTQTRADITLTIKSREGTQIKIDVNRAKDAQGVIREIGELIEKSENRCPSLESKPPGDPRSQQ